MFLAKEPPKKEEPLSYWEKVKQEKMAEAKKKLNILLSKRSAETSEQNNKITTGFAGGAGKHPTVGALFKPSASSSAKKLPVIGFGRDAGEAKRGFAGVPKQSSRGIGSSKRPIGF